MPAVERIAVTGDGGPEGGNSAYWLPDRGVLIDPGPPGDAAYQRLVDGIEETGADRSAVEYVLCTHWHADHVGGAVRLAGDADARIAMHDTDAPLLAEYATAREKRVERDAETLRSWGVPDGEVDSLVAADTPSPLPDAVDVDRLADGDTVAGLETVHTPGHTAGHAAFRTDTATFVGDAVLRTCTPNVGGGDTRQSDPLGAYLETLDRLDDPEARAYPGHGGPFDLGERIDELGVHHRDRTERVIDVLAEDGPATPWAVAASLFGEMRGYHVKFGAGEAFAHLAYLAGVDAVACVDRNPLRYELVASPAGARERFE